MARLDTQRLLTTHYVVFEEIWSVHGKHEYSYIFLLSVGVSSWEIENYILTLLDDTSEV